MQADLAGKSKTRNVQDYLYLGTSKLPGGSFTLSHTARYSRDFLRECAKHEQNGFENTKLTSTLVLICVYHVIRGRILFTRSILGYSIEGFLGALLLLSFYHQRKRAYLLKLGSLLVEFLHRSRSKSNFDAKVSRNKSTFIRRCHNSNVSDFS
jgi:hypothetical protein